MYLIINKPFVLLNQLTFQHCSYHRIPSVDKHHSISRVMLKDKKPKKSCQSQNSKLFHFVNEEYVGKACFNCLQTVACFCLSGLLRAIWMLLYLFQLTQGNIIKKNGS